MPWPSPATLSAFLIIVAFVVLAAVFAGVHAVPPSRRAKTAALGLAAATAWLLLTGLPMGLGIITPEHAFPAMPIFLLACLIAALLFSFSRAGLAIADNTPIWALVGFQGFRLPLEIVLHLWYGEGVMPVQMTWSGANIDVVSGIVALLLAPFARRSRIAAWIAGSVGLALLFNVIRIAIRSMPTPLLGYPDPMLAPLYLPINYIASVCVVGALIGHMLLFRRLLRAA
ncbi:MAG TPA: hypothetical protein ENJ18_07185 [Nannocystis exedens]|nr:hypothetical protein [Nannocystis exedens]